MSGHDDDFDAMLADQGDDRPGIDELDDVVVLVSSNDTEDDLDDTDDDPDAVVCGPDDLEDVHPLFRVGPARAPAPTKPTLAPAPVVAPAPTPFAAPEPIPEPEAEAPPEAEPEGLEVDRDALVLIIGEEAHFRDAAG